MSFVDRFSKVYGGSWSVKSNEVLSQEERNDINSAEVVMGQYGLSICFHCNEGNVYGKLSSNSSLKEGDVVDTQSVRRLTLGKKGESDIERYDGSKA